MGVSTVPAARAALQALMVTAVPSATVTYGMPGQILPDEAVYAVGVEWDDETWPNIGNVKREERYRLVCYMPVTASPDSQQTASERVMALFGQIESAIFATPTLGVTGVLYAEPKPRRLSEDRADAGYSARLEFTVNIRARF